MDWDKAYNNADAVADAADFPPRWLAEAEAFRQSAGAARLARPYGQSAREKFDLFLPAGTPKGLVVFVHGGYWHKFDRGHWSWVAKGPLAHGWAVSIPGYTLCPEIRISGIARQIAAAVTKGAAEIEGPIRLAGHSAGGHLITRVLCGDLLGGDIARRIAGTVAISGLPDLIPFVSTAMNGILGLTEEETARESPARLTPGIEAPLTCWVGAEELPEFLRQNALLDIWSGSGVDVETVTAPGRHHFDVIEPLADPASTLVARILALPSLQ